MYKALLVEDDDLNSKFLQNLLETYAPEISIIGICTSVAEAIGKIRTQETLIIFLDIELGSIENGFDLIALLEGRNDNIVIVSAFPEYAVQAFRTRTIDFLTKPVRITELKHAIKRVIEQRQLQEINDQSVIKYDDSISVPIYKKSVVIDKNDILFIVSELSKTYLYLKNGECLKSLDNIGKYEKKLNPNQFLRVHLSCIVNRSEIVSFDSKSTKLFLEMSNQQIIQVARRSKKKILQMLK